MQTGAPGPVWIHLPDADRQSLAELGGRVGLPPELVTYCLLDQQRPKVVPCAAWLYSAWQVPAFTLKSPAGRDELFYCFVEIKACLGPTTVVTTQGRARRAKRLLASLLPDGDALVRGRLGNLLVTLVERIGDVYLAHIELAVAPSAVADSGNWRGRQARTAAETQLVRHAYAHRDAIQKLIAKGRRWLDPQDVERLRRVADRLASLGSDPWSPEGPQVA